MDFRADQAIETRIGKVTFYRPDYVSGQIVRAIKRSNFGQEALELNEQLGYYMDKYAANPTEGFGGLTVEVRRAWGVEATIYVHCRPDYEAHLLTDELKMQLYPVKFEVEVNAGSTIRSASAARAFAALMSEAADLACLLEAIATSSKLLAIMRPERKEAQPMTETRCLERFKGAHAMATCILDAGHDGDHDDVLPRRTSR